MRSDVVTDDNGSKTVVRLREEAGALQVDGPAGTYTTALGTMTDVCFWNIAITTQRQIIDGQNGELGPVRTVPPVEETITVLGRPLPTTRYGFTGPPTTAATSATARSVDRTGRYVRAEVDPTATTCRSRSLGEAGGPRAGPRPRWRAPARG